jgi:putative transposase
LGGKRGRLICADDKSQVICLIQEACTSGARKHKACEILNISLRTLERWTKENGIEDKRKFIKRTPANKLTQEQYNMVLTISNSKKYQDLPPCKIVPLLADSGQYIASESTFYRILRAENQLCHRQPSKIAKHHKPNEYLASGSNQVWSWDISYLSSNIKGLYYYLYLIVDVFSRKIVGFSVYEQESANHASSLITQACLDENIMRDQIVLHSDNGGPMKGATMLATLERLGVLPSFSRPSVSDDNPYSESLFRTLKYHPTFPRISKFDSINTARDWCEKFVYWYNNEHLHSGLKFITPQQRHSGLDVYIMKKRDAVYKLAQEQNPERWSKKTRNWTLPNIVTLNPNKKNKKNVCDLEVLEELHNVNGDLRSA